MKRLFLVLLILAMGTTVFCGFRNATSDLQRVVAHRETALKAKSEVTTHMRLERDQLIQRVHEAKRQLASRSSRVAPDQLASEILSDHGWRNLSAEQAEQLLAELGFDWNTTGEFLMVSKKSLGGISLGGFEGAKLTDTARAVLAITPEEQGRIETLTQQLSAERSEWVKTHAQREEPSGDVVAKYSLPVDTNLSQIRSNTFTDGIFATLGNERGELLRSYAYSWMRDAGMLDSAPSKDRDATENTALTVTRYKSGDELQINFTIKQAGSTMTTTASPWQPFPQAFKPLFPGGWTDLAAREGFELPKAFQKTKAQ